MKSVYVGKKLSNFRETVTSPALGKVDWKITLLPKDCGRDEEGDYKHSYGAIDKLYFDIHYEA